MITKERRSLKIKTAYQDVLVCFRLVTRQDARRRHRRLRRFEFLLVKQTFAKQSEIKTKVSTFNFS